MAGNFAHAGRLGVTKEKTCNLPPFLHVGQPHFSAVFLLHQNDDSTMMRKILSVCALLLSQVLAAENNCNSNGDICARFEDGFNSRVLGEISEWWDELEKNVRPLKCEFPREEEDEGREQVSK